jgi:DNA repair protein RecO (recombination protein O)
MVFVEKAGSDIRGATVLQTVFRGNCAGHDRPANFPCAALDSTTAILLRRTRFSDSSLIVTWFTLQSGKLKTIAKGALRPKSRFAGALDLFYACEISFARSRKSELHILREASALDSRETLRRSHVAVALAAYCVELLDLATEPDHPAPELFDLLSRVLAHLDSKSPTRRALLHFESELARLSGIQHPGITPIMAIGRACHQIPSSRADLLKTLPEQ